MRRARIQNTILTAAWAVLAAACVYVAFKALDYRRHVNYFLDKYTNVVSEFSGRQKYAGANASLASAERQPNRIVFLGDQIFESWKLENDFPGYEAVNRGITGQWLSGFLLRLRPDVIELKPRAVVIQFSSYNFRPQGTIKEVEDYLSGLAELCRFHGVEPILSTVIPVRKNRDVFKSDAFEPYAVSDSLAKFNGWLRDFCHQNGYLLADFNLAMADRDGYLPREFSIDNTHLNAEGHKRLKAPILEALGKLDQKSLGERVAAQRGEENVFQDR